MACRRSSVLARPWRCHTANFMSGTVVLHDVRVIYGKVWRTLFKVRDGIPPDGHQGSDSLVGLNDGPLGIIDEA